MTLPEITQELRRIRAACHSRSQQATENDLSRLIARLEDPDIDSLLNGVTLVSHSLEVKYIKG